nr:probable UDP-sugar transporter protein SLC35A4 isoform X1 [Macaca fascicularis]
MNSSGARRPTHRTCAARTRARVRSSLPGSECAHTQPETRPEGVTWKYLGEAGSATRKAPHPFQKCSGSAFALSKDGRGSRHEGGGDAPAQQVRLGRWRMTSAFLPLPLLSQEAFIGKGLSGSPHPLPIPSF